MTNTEDSNVATQAMRRNSPSDATTHASDGTLKSSFGSRHTVRLSVLTATAVLANICQSEHLLKFQFYTGSKSSPDKGYKSAVFIVVASESFPGVPGPRCSKIGFNNDVTEAELFCLIGINTALSTAVNDKKCGEMNPIDIPALESEYSVNLLSLPNQSTVDYMSGTLDGAGNIYMDHPEEILNPAAINPAFIPIIVTHTATFIIGVIGNVVVIFTWTGKGRLRSPTASFLVSLAIADLLLLVVFVPLETLEYFVITWDEGGSICRVSSYIEMLSGMATVLNLVAVSIERFLVIVYPMRARSFCTISKSRKGLLVVWILAMILASPIVYTKSVHPLTYYNNSTAITIYYCLEGFDSFVVGVAIYQLFVLFLIPGLFMIVCYFIVIKVLWSSTKNIERLTAHAGSGMRSASSQASSFELFRTERKINTTPSTSLTSLATNGVNASHSKNVATARWMPGSTGGTRATRNKKQQNGAGDELGKAMKASPLSTLERSLPADSESSPICNAQEDTAALKPNGRGRGKATQFPKHLVNEGRNKEIDEVDTDLELNLLHPRSTQSISIKRKKNQHIHHHQTQARKQVIKMLLLVIILFLVCWGPRLVFNVLVRLEMQSYTSMTYTIRVASYLLSFIHSALNPFIYGLMSSTFRNIVFKSCAGRDAAGPESVGVSGRAAVGGKQASGTWAVDELVEDDIVDPQVTVTSVTVRRLLDLPQAPTRLDRLV